MKLMIILVGLVGGTVVLGDYAGIVFLWGYSEYLGPFLMTDWNTTFMPFYFANLLYIGRLALVLTNLSG